MQEAGFVIVLSPQVRTDVALATGIIRANKVENKDARMTI